MGKRTKDRGAWIGLVLAVLFFGGLYYFASQQVPDSRQATGTRPIPQTLEQQVRDTIQSNTSVESILRTATDRFNERIAQIESQSGWEDMTDEQKINAIANDEGVLEISGQTILAIRQQNIPDAVKILLGQSGTHALWAQAIAEAYVRSGELTLEVLRSLLLPQEFSISGPTIQQIVAALNRGEISEELREALEDAQIMVGIRLPPHPTVERISDHKWLIGGKYLVKQEGNKLTIYPQPSRGD